MLTRKERETLETLQKAVDNFKDLCMRLHHGNTNHTLAYCELKHVEARTAYKDFLDQITEKNMAYDDMSKHETQSERFGVRSISPPQNPSFTLKASLQVFEVSIFELQRMFSRELGVPVERLAIVPKFRQGESDPEGVLDTPQFFDGLTITVTNK